MTVVTLPRRASRVAPVVVEAPQLGLWPLVVIWWLRVVGRYPLIHHYRHRTHRLQKYCLLPMVLTVVTVATLAMLTILALLVKVAMLVIMTSRWQPNHRGGGASLAEGRKQTRGPGQRYE